MNSYKLPDMNLWQCRKDAAIGDYFCHNVFPCNLDTDILKYKNFAILGFESDLGVQRNLGRVGAKSGPDEIRKCLSRLAIRNVKECYDCGNILIDNDDSLLSGQQLFATYITKILKAGITPIVLGGGHETAYAHYMGLLEGTSDDIAILNFDAHFDLRMVANDNEGTSGTPFRQIYNLCKEKGRDFSYYCIGIQPFSNTNGLYSFAKESETTYLEASEVNFNPDSVKDLVNKIISRHKQIYITVCLDVFHYSYAPGVSAPQALGINPYVVINALRSIREADKVFSMDIVELNPLMDIDNHTARLAANIIGEFYYS